MAIEVGFHPAATLQLSELHAYIAADAGDVRASAYLGRLETACLWPGAFPQRGRAPEDLGMGMRPIVFEGRAAIIYRVTNDAVEILGVYFGGRDLTALVLPE